MPTVPVYSLSVRMGSGIGGFAGLAEAVSDAADETSETTAKDEEKAELIEIFDAENLPHIITESHIVISPDTQHGFAMVQHFTEQFFTPYVKANMPSITRRFARSDGCRGQYKGRHHFGWVSQHGIEEQLETIWSWFCSCHGKCLCDPEGGTCKNAAQFYETRSEVGGLLPSSWEYYMFCKANLETTSTLGPSKCSGILSVGFTLNPDRLSPLYKWL